MLNSTNPDTLKGYDMMITISQDAINKQFQALYDKEIPTALMPDPEQLEGFAALPAAEHYINHNIKIVPETLENWDDEIFEGIRPDVRPDNGKFFCPSDKWLEGEIDAPFVTFGEEPGNFRCVRVNLKFRTGKLHFNFNGRELKQKLDGCTLSWIADLTHAPVEDFVEEIVNASEKKEEHTLVADSVIEKFKALNQHSYTVTTLFCLFQGKRIVNSFEFLNMQGTSELGSTKATEAANLISSYFKALSANPTSASTPNNPFVLGYGLTQKLETIPEEDKKRAENAPYFIPRQFDLTVTKGDGDYSNGVINYCLLTHRPDNEGLRAIDYEKDVGAGFWDHGNTPYKRIRADGKASGADGVMAFSREVFRDYWLARNFLSYFKVSMEALARDLVPQDDNVASAQSTQTYNESTVTAYQGQTNKLCLTQEYEFSPMRCQDMDTDKMKESEDLSAFLEVVLTASKKIGLELKYLQRRQAKGYAEAVLTYSSDVQKNPDLGKSSDTNRKIYFDVGLRSLLTITQEASGICNINRLFQDKLRVAAWMVSGGIGLAIDMAKNPEWFINIFTEWRAARQANVQIVTKAGFDMCPAGDTWSLGLDKDKSRTTVPIGAEELKRQVIPPVTFTTLENILEVQKMQDLSQRMEGDGVIIDLHNHDMFQEFGTSKGMDRFAKPANQWASKFEELLEANMAALASSLMTKLILPAGNVFEFKSLNTDEEGHVYSLISYKTPTDVSKL